MRSATPAALLLLVLVGARSSLSADEELWVGTASFPGPLLPVTALFSTETGQVPQEWSRRLNFDLSFGPFIPIDDDETFDSGMTVDFKIQGEVLRYVFLGWEFAFTVHKKDAGQVLSDGTMEKFYFLFPVEVDIPLGDSRENPFSLRLGVSPGLQLAVPFVDRDLERSLQFDGYDLEEEDILTFNLRARVGLRFPLSPNSGFLLEAVYDWAEGNGEAVLRDLIAGTSQKVRHDVNLGGLSILVGFQLVF